MFWPLIFFANLGVYLMLGFLSPAYKVKECENLEISKKKNPVQPSNFISKD